MKSFRMLGLVSAFYLSASALVAQEANQIGQLQQQIDALQRQLDEMKRKQAESEAAQKQIKEQMEKASAGAARQAPAIAAPSWQPGDPLRIGRGKSYLDLSFDALFAVGGTSEKNVTDFQQGGHDPSQRGFTVQNLETVFSGVVDPYFRGQANLVYFITPEGESELEIEEAFAETLSLPANLQLKAGQFFTEFGRHNPTHPHAWSFADTPLVNARFLGPDGLRNPGVRLAWLMPASFYSELSLAVQNSQGETASSFRSGGGHAHGDAEEEGLPFAFRHADNDRGVSGVGDMLFTPRYSASFDLSETQTLLAGVSAAFGPNDSGATGDTATQIYGADLFWKWKPVNHSGGFPFISFQTEAMLRKYRAGPHRPGRRRPRPRR